MIIKNIEIKQTATGKPYKAILLDDERKINVFQFHSKYAEIVVGTELSADEIIKDGKFWNLKDEQAKSKNEKYSKLGQAIQLEEKKSENFKEGQDRKQAGIAYFNSVNSALEVLKMLGQNQPAQIKEYLPQWREWFLEQYRTYEAKDITEKTKPFNS